jgi:tetratricopeptide (TPR) repeat protein/TolB-like protein
VQPFVPASGSGSGAEAFGFAAEVVHSLCRVPGLAVTARTSSFFFPDGSAPPRVIGERLHVAHLLTGEMRIDAGGTWLSATLWDTREGERIWTRTFNTSASGLPGMRNELVDAVIEAVPASGSGARPPEADVEAAAWPPYLRGLYFGDQLGGSDPEAAIEAFRKALGEQQDFAPAWAGIAEAWLSPTWPQGSEGPDPERARAAIESALQANPASAEALGLLAHLLHRVDWDFPGAAETAQQALELEPNDPGLMNIAGRALFTMGDFGKAEALLEESIKRDPLNLGNRLSFGLLQEFSGHYDDALTTYRIVLGLNPDIPGAHAFRARIKVIQDKGDSALRESGQESNPFWKDYSRILALTALGRGDEAQPDLDRMMEQHRQDAAYQVAELLAFRGDVDGSFEWLDRAYRQRDAGMSELKGNYFLGNLRDDARWLELLEKLGLPLD